MFGLETLTFLTPLALAALALLPVIWWLMRSTPPRPKTVRFPPFRLLLDLISREDEPERMPWWLILLRLTIAALVIFAVAHPLLSEGPVQKTGKGPLLIVVDDGWAAASNWDVRQQVLQDIVSVARRNGTPVTLAGTTGRLTPQPLAPASAQSVAERAGALVPQALDTDRPALLERLKREFTSSASLQVIWLSDGLDAGTAAAFSEGLTGLAGGNATLNVMHSGAEKLPIVLARPSLEEGKLKARARRADTGKAEEITVELTARNGRSLAAVKLAFAAGQAQGEADIALPLELRNDAASLRISGARSAGAVYLFDDRWRRKTVAIHSGASLELAQPLLDPLYYVSRALEPYSRISKAGKPADIDALLETGQSMLVLADVGKLPEARRQTIDKWVRAGGVLLRFAGPRLAGSQDELVPVKLRSGGRSLGSALSWEKPQALANFSDNGPLAGLAPDESVRVSRQVLADPSPELAGRVWASLEDGTPLITASRRGSGLIVLFHVTANADWSNLPLTGQFVEILRRIVDLAPGAGTRTETARTGAIETAGAFTPTRSLDGFGALTNPPPGAAPVPASEIVKARPRADRPAGLYARAGGTRAINTLEDDIKLQPAASYPGAAAVSDYAPSPARPLAGILFTLALALFVIDCFIALVLSGRWRWPWRRAAATAAITAMMFAGGTALTTPQAHAQSTPPDPAEEKFAMENVLETRLAYVVTGDKSVDEVSFAGLAGLNNALARRTSIEPGQPTAVNIETDEIVFFPLIYWPVLANTRPPSSEALARIDTFMKNGGTIFFDTRDRDTGISAFTGEASPATLALRRILEQLDIPALEPVPPGHVLTKSFYLLQAFPGRYAGGPLWVEARQQTGKRGPGNSDGVTSIMIGSNDYAAAWSLSDTGEPLFAAVPGGERQREFAIRTGINIVMYALTGNYKADQVHIPALLERLGQ